MSRSAIYSASIKPAFPIVSKERANPSSANVSTIVKSLLDSLARAALRYIICSGSTGETANRWPLSRDRTPSMHRKCVRCFTLSLCNIFLKSNRNRVLTLPMCRSISPSARIPPRRPARHRRQPGRLRRPRAGREHRCRSYLKGAGCAPRQDRGVFCLAEVAAGARRKPGARGDPCRGSIPGNDNTAMMKPTAAPGSTARDESSPIFQLFGGSHAVSGTTITRRQSGHLDTIWN